MSLTELGVTGLPDWQGLEPGRVDIGVWGSRPGSWDWIRSGQTWLCAWGHWSRPGPLNVLGYASMASDTLGEALQLTVLFEPYRLGFVSCALQSGPTTIPSA